MISCGHSFFSVLPYTAMSEKSAAINGQYFP